MRHLFTHLALQTHLRRRIGYLLFALCLACNCLAELPTALDIPNLPAGTASLPESKASQAGLLINSLNVSDFRPIIITEIYNLIKTGVMEFEASRSLDYTWRFDSDWEGGSSKGVINTKGEYQVPIKLPRGFAFSKGEELKTELNQTLLGSKILWNVQSAWWSLKIIDLFLDVVRIKEGVPDRNFSAKLQRIYPRALEGGDNSAQLFREKITALQPAMLKGFSWLTFRFFGADDDVFWIYSTAINKSRQITGSNRSDAMVSFSVSPDDLLSWSGKMEAIQASTVKTQVALVPFPRKTAGELVTLDHGCYSPSDLAQESPSADALTRPSAWNYQSKKYLKGAAWLPTHAVFVPRELWRVELVQEDPYSLYGRQVLYIDLHMNLPVYKFVYDRAGKPYKTIMTAFGLHSTPDKKRSLPFPEFQVVLDHTKKEAFVINYSSVRYCEEMPDDIKLADFDPNKLG